ncbi:MAG: S49 family peptidase, partial [Anaerolineae bacterium]|nr:S49 family peptidase [Anaerolineae bacterium]
MVKRWLKALARLNPLRGLRYLLFSLGNLWRSRYRKLDYILLSLPTSIPPMPEKRGWLQRRFLGDPPTSLLELDRLFKQIGNDPRPKGIVITLRGLQMTLADLQSLRQSIIRLRKQGKRVIFYAQNYENATYYLASAGDEIILQPGGTMMTLGLVSQPSFFKNALDTIGVEIDAVAISPFKSALDTFTREDISPDAQAQLDWLLDSRYEIILEGIAEGRRVPLSAVRDMIDQAPHLDRDALKAGYVDAVLNEEALGTHLNAEHLVPLS